MDLLMQYPGFYESGVAVPPLQNPQRSDVLDSWLPEWIFIRDQVIHGNLPFWDPFRDGGMPTNLPSPPPITLFLRADFLPYFVLGNGVGFTLGKVAILTITGLGAYKLCRDQFSIIPALFSGITFMMSGVVSEWLATTVDCVIMWFPWILWSLKKAVEEPSIKRMAVVSTIVLLMIVGDFPFLTFLSLAIGISFLLWNIGIKYFKNNQSIKKPLAYALIGMVLGLGLSGIYIVPFKEWLDHSYVSWRQGGTGLSPHDIDVLWLPFKYVLQVGNHVVPSFEKTGYIGKTAVLLLPFAIIGILIERKKNSSWLFPLFFIIISLFLITIVFNIQPISSYVYRLPIFNDNPSSRAISILGLTLSILAAYSLQKIMDWIDNLGWKLKKKKICKISSLIIVLPLLLIQTIDISVTRINNAVVPADTFFPSTPTLSYVREHLIPGQSVVATDAYMISGSLTGYEIPEWFAQALLNPQEKEVLGQIVENAWKDPFSASFPLSEVNLHSDYMNALFVRYVLATKDQVQKYSVPDNWLIIEKGQNIDILENKKCPPGAYLVPYSISPNAYNQNSITTEGIKILKHSTDYSEYLITRDTSDTARLVVPLHFWPGWKAYVDGKPVEIEPYLTILSSIKINQGTSLVEFRYEPSSIEIGIALSLISVIILFSLWFFESRKRINKIQ